MPNQIYRQEPRTFTSHLIANRAAASLCCTEYHGLGGRVWISWSFRCRPSGWSAQCPTRFRVTLQRIPGRGKLPVLRTGAVLRPAADMGRRARGTFGRACGVAGGTSWVPVTQHHAVGATYQGRPLSPRLHGIIGQNGSLLQQRKHCTVIQLSVPESGGGGAVFS